jgi:hypothetical protein
MLSLTRFSARYSLRESDTWLLGSQLPSATKLLPERVAYATRLLGTTLVTLIFFFQGVLDIYTLA